MEISLGTNILECGVVREISPELLEILADGGVRLVDLHMGARCDTKVSPLRVVNRFMDYTNKAHIGRVKSWLKNLSLRPVCMHAACCYPLDSCHLDESVRELTVSELKMCITTAGEFGIPVMVVHAGDEIRNGGTAEEKLVLLRKSIAELLPIAQRSKVRMAFENLLEGSLFYCLEDLIKFVDEIDEENVGVCLDTGHLNLRGGNIADAVAEVGSKLYTLHVHDNDGSYDQHLAPFSGSIDWNGFVPSLKKIGYTGTVNLEIRPPESEEGLTVEFIRGLMSCAEGLFG